MMIKFTLFFFLLNSFIFSHSLLADEINCQDGAGIIQVQFGDVVHCMINTKVVDVYAITLNKGDNVHAIAYATDECNGFAPEIVAFDSKSMVLADNKSSVNKCGGERIEFVATETGIYTFAVNDYYEGRNRSTSKYNIEFQCASGGCVNNTLLAKQECTATFDGANLSVPQLELGDKDFWVNFKLISADTIQFQLTDFGEK